MHAFKARGGCTAGWVWVRSLRGAGILHGKIYNPYSNISKNFIFYRKQFLLKSSEVQILSSIIRRAAVLFYGAKYSISRIYEHPV